jgi:hypothetical protein
VEDVMSRQENGQKTESESGTGDVNIFLPGESVDGKQVTLDEVQSNKLRWEISEIMERMAADVFVLAAKLHEVKTRSLYLRWGYRTFDEYINSEEIKFARRKALYHVKIWEWFGQLPSDVRDKVKEVGWCKLVHLTGVVNETNVDEWTNTAKRLTVNELLEEKKRYVAEQRALAEAKAAANTGDFGVGGFSAEEEAKKDIPEKVHTKNFKLYEDQLSVVNDALTIAGELSKSEKSGHNLTLICQDFCSHNADVRPEPDVYLRRIEQIFKIKLIGLNLQTKEIVFGEDTMQTVMRIPEISE